MHKQQYQNLSTDIKNIKLNIQDINNFLSLIKAEKSTNDIDFINNIIKGVFDNIPFQNLTLLNARKQPSIKEIIQHMLLGIGGLCDVRNAFMYILLNTLKFNIHFLSANMNKPNCHIILLIYINSNRYLIDTGNGFPYLEMINLNNNKIFIHKYIHHRLTMRNNIFYMQHKSQENKKWVDNYNFNLHHVDFSSFHQMLKKQYSKLGWGPFTTGIRINKWYDDGGIIIRDKLCLKLSNSKIKEKYQLKNFDDFECLIKDEFSDNNFINKVNIKNAWEKINNEHSYK